MNISAVRQLLQVWERGALGTSTRRGLLLLSAACDERPEALLAFSIGRRDALLLDMHEQLFGPRIAALATCEACREHFELGFELASVRVGFDACSGAHRYADGDYEIEFRSANSADLLVIERAATAAIAQRALLARCVLSARKAAESITADALPGHIVSGLAERMTELDAQAEVAFDTQCAACGRPQRLWFDIVTHLWSVLDRWARAMLSEVHQLAAAYGWSEQRILALSSVRRRAYLRMVGGPAVVESAWQA
jgi:hypothetical protein